MTLSDATVIAYVDGALDAAERAEVEAAMALDPDLARRVQAFQAQRGHSKAQREATVTDLRRVRAARKAEAAQAAAAARRTQPPRPPWGWFEWGAMAASAAAGVLFAYLAIKSPDSEHFANEHGQFVARADLDLALSHQLASDPIPGSAVRIGVSFKSKTGHRCRTFLLKEGQRVGGLACREGGEWKVQVVANAERSAAPDGGHQQAGAEMPAAVLAAAQTVIDGEPFNAEQEVAARERGWEE